MQGGGDWKLNDDTKAKLGDVIGHLRVVQERPDDDVVDDDLILVWGAQRRIITGSDLLGRLMRGIATVEVAKPQRQVSRAASPSASPA